MGTHKRRGLLGAAGVLALSLLLGLGSVAGDASAKEYIIGLQCDRSGPTMNTGPFICTGVHDYVKVFNKKNTIPGGQIVVMEIEHGYNVPRGMEAYERHKAAGALTIAIYGTPHTVALTPKLSEDRILGTSPGFGSASGANGLRFPFLFPAAATYWSQSASAVKFIEDNWKGEKQPKIAYLYYDNPAGREPFPILDDLQKQLGFELEKYAVPAPAIEMRPQVLDIARKYRADWVIAHLFGRGPGVSLKEFSRMGFPRERMVGLVWAGGESDIRIAGWDTAEGYYTMQFAHVGSRRDNLNHPVLREIADIYKAEGKPLPEEMDLSVYYNRGITWGALHSEAIRAAVAAKGPNITSVDVKEAMERIDGFSLDGFMAPVKMTPEDHEGGGGVRIFQVKSGGYTPVTDWIWGYRDVVLKHVRAGQ